MKRKADEIILDGVVVGTSPEGKGIVKQEGKVIFVDGAMEGDVVDIRVRKNRKKYLVGEIILIKTPSKDRIEPHCQHFEKCGGCSLQYMSYATQIAVKQKSVYDAMERIGKVEIEQLLPIIGSIETQYYRNKLDFAFSSKRWLTNEEVQNLPENVDRSGVGFHIAGMFDKVLDLEHCYHQQDPSNEIRNRVKAYAKEHSIPFYDVRAHEGVMRNMIVRCTTLGEWMVIVAFTVFDEKTKGLMEFIKTSFPFITSLLYTVNTKKNDVIYDLEICTYAGRDYIVEQLGDYQFKIGPKSFFQTNSKQAKVLYDLTREMADIQPNDIVYDLYTGVGSIAIYCSKNAKKVVGIELIEEAIVDAKENAKFNGVDNCEFYASDMKKMFNSDFIGQHGAPNIIITDPPRAGMDEDVITTLQQSGCPKIVYVSCNPGTQARDLALLSSHYKVVKVQPVDMFPHTVHVESVALLERI